MNINSYFNSKSKKMIVSNEKGEMQPRDYQDNIDDILILEDVIEEQESDLRLAKNTKDEHNV